MKRTKLLIFLSLILLIFTSCKNKSNDDISDVPTEKVTDATKITEPKPVPYSLVDGREIDEKDKNSRVIGTTIDNHPNARPQSGLNSASIIYEFKAEGEFTRYLAIFQNTDAPQIGPIRSARPYFVQTIAEYDGVLGHFGGSTEGMSKISDLGINNLDGMALDGTIFYRNHDVGKFAPHNAYTSIELLKKGMENYNYKDTSNFQGFKFDLFGDKLLEQMKNGESAQNIEIPFFSSYIVDFEYDSNNGKYFIARNDSGIIDEYDKKTVYASNIIIQFADSSIIGGSAKLNINHIGSGKGKYIQHGKIIDIEWSKSTATDRTIFTVENGEELVLAPGQTWIEVVDSNTNITIN